jgi:hypothetical protein
MANYHTRFACLLELHSAENVSRAMAVFATCETALEEGVETTDFEVSNDPEMDGTDLLITSGDGSGDPNQVADFVGRVGQACGLRGHWGFVWAITCDRNRVDAFGGGALVIDLGTGEVARSFDCDEWLGQALDSLRPSPSAQPVAVPVGAMPSAHP